MNKRAINPFMVRTLADLYLKHVFRTQLEREAAESDTQSFDRLLVDHKDRLMIDGHNNHGCLIDELLK